MSINPNTEQCKICFENVRRYKDFREIILPDEEETIQKVLSSVGIDIISSSKDSITFLCLGCAKCLRFTHDFIRQAIDSQCSLNLELNHMKSEEPFEIHTIIESQRSSYFDQTNSFSTTPIEEQNLVYSQKFSVAHEDFYDESTDTATEIPDDEGGVCRDNTSSGDNYEMDSSEEEWSIRSQRTEKKRLNRRTLRNKKTSAPENIEEFASVCTKCNHNYQEKLSLQEHLLSFHRNDQNFICNVCQKPFLKREHFVEHLQKFHIGKKFSCNLLTDQKSHSNEKPFKCKQCSKTFSSKNSLETHFKVLHSKLAYKCKYCEGRFKHYKSLIDHKNFIHFKTSYKCPNCDKGLPDVNYLKRHFKQVHRSEISEEQLKEVRNDYKKQTGIIQRKLEISMKSSKCSKSKR